MTWACPACGSQDGVDICDLVPQYWAATVSPDGEINYVEDSGEFFYEGNELLAVFCLTCREDVSAHVHFVGDKRPATVYQRLEYRL